MPSKDFDRRCDYWIFPRIDDLPVLRRQGVDLAAFRKIPPACFVDHYRHIRRDSLAVRGVPRGRVISGAIRVAPFGSDLNILIIASGMNRLEF